MKLEGNILIFFKNGCYLYKIFSDRTVFAFSILMLVPLHGSNLFDFDKTDYTLEFFNQDGTTAPLALTEKQRELIGLFSDVQSIEKLDVKKTKTLPVFEISLELT